MTFDYSQVPDGERDPVLLDLIPFASRETAVATLGHGRIVGFAKFRGAMYAVIDPALADGEKRCPHCGRIERGTRFCYCSNDD